MAVFSSLDFKQLAFKKVKISVPNFSTNLSNGVIKVTPVQLSRAQTFRVRPKMEDNIKMVKQTCGQMGLRHLCESLMCFTL